MLGGPDLKLTPNELQEPSIGKNDLVTIIAP